MRIFVKARPGAYEGKVEQIDGEHFVVSVREPPINGLANLAIIKALANHFNTSQRQIRLVSGRTSRNKVFEIS